MDNRKDKTMNDIKVPPFTEEQQKLIKMTEKLANSRKICDADGIDDDIKDINEIISETIAKIENQKQTNFQRITTSPEALAEFIKTIIDVCYTCDKDEYPQCTVCWCNPLAVKKWLNEEYK